MEAKPNKKSTADIVRALARLVVILILLGIIFTIFGELIVSRMVEREPYIPRILSDMRSMSTCIESYFDDHMAYPAAGSGEEGANNLPGADPETLRLSTFRVKTSADDPQHTLTTPVAFCLYYFADPFAKTKGATFGYYSAVVTKADDQSTTHGWILWSPGPDRDYDIIPATDYDPTSHPTKLLINKTYDPTNGAKSNGDLWSAKRRFGNVLGARF